MDINEILNIVFIIISILSTIVAYYFTIKEKLLKEVNGKIDEAEGTITGAEEKMSYVVDELYNLVPLPYKTLFSKDFIRKLVQCAFDKIESYADKQVNKK